MAREPVAHRKLAVIETEDAALLERIFADAELRPFLWLRLGPRRAAIDPLAHERVRQRLKAMGLPCRYTSDLSD